MHNQGIDVAAWHDFFATLGTASATVLGLLFVALSLRSDEDTKDLTYEQGIWSIGGVSLLSFANVVVVALTFLLPNLTTFILGIPIAVMALISSIASVRSQGRARAVADRRANIFLVLAPLGCGAQIIFAGAILYGDLRVLLWLAFIEVILLLNGLLAAWSLLASPVFARVTNRTGGQR